MPDFDHTPQRTRHARAVVTRLRRWCTRWLPALALAAAQAPALAQSSVPTPTAAPADTARATALVSVRWLQDQLRAGGSAEAPLLLDASPAPAYAARHLPGALHVDLFAYGVREAPLPERERFWQSMGLVPGRKVVIYDQGGTYFAPRLWWELYYLGYPAADLMLLDGGLSKWVELGGAVSAERAAAPARGSWRPGPLRETVRVRLPEFLQASADPAGHALVDALEPAYYYGEAKFFDRAGHVPQALLWPASDFFAADKTFKPAEEIRRMAAHLGVRPEQAVHTHCGGGGAAAVPFFALHVVAGFPKVTLYRESQMEWLRDERNLPFWTYAAPGLLRSAAWLDTWGGPMLRAFGLSGLSVVDVRPAPAYGLGHVPHAVSVPAETWAAQGRQPQALAALLGPAGIHPAHEAVIVSEGGINPRSALAFALLHNLGQRRVSLLAESVDEWGLRGHALTKQPTVVGARRTPQDLVVAPAAYPAGNLTGLVLPNPEATRGPYPKVYVAAGAQPPTRRPPGDARVIALPAGDLVQPDGSPKPAPALWKRLSQAGVPRYAELITFADDPGEAAVTLVVLKLMGYPDVKLWWPAP